MLLVITLATLACSQDGHDAVFDGSVGSTISTVNRSAGRQSGEPAEIGRTAGEPAETQPRGPVVHVLGSVRSLGDGTAGWESGVSVVSDDTATIASLACSFADENCLDSSLVDWATGRVEVVNAATVAASEAGAQVLSAGLSTLEAGGIEVVGFGSNEAEAVSPVVVETPEFEIAIFAISLSATPESAASSTSSGIAGPSSFPALLAAVDESLENDQAVIVLVDWGDRELRAPTNEQLADVQELVDHGIDVLVGHGADFLQRFDRVENTTVTYSLGNTTTSSAEALRADTAVLRLEFDRPGQSCLLPSTSSTSGPILDHPEVTFCNN